MFGLSGTRLTRTLWGAALLVTVVTIPWPCPGAEEPAPPSPQQPNTRAVAEELGHLHLGRGRQLLNDGGDALLATHHFLRAGQAFELSDPIAAASPLTTAALVGQSLLATYLVHGLPEVIEWLPDSERLLVIEGGSTAVYSPPLQDPVAAYPDAALRDVVFLPPDHIVSRASPKIFNIRSGAYIPVEPQDPAPSAAFLSVSARRLIVTQVTPRGPDQNVVLAICDVASGKQVSSIRLNERPVSAEFSPRGDKLLVEAASAANPGFHAIEIWKKGTAVNPGDPEEWERARRWDKIDHDVMTMFAPDEGHLLLWPRSDNPIVVRNLASGEIERAFAGGRKGKEQNDFRRRCSPAPAPWKILHDGRRLAFVAPDDTFQIVNWTTGERLLAIPHPKMTGFLIDDDEKSVVLLSQASAQWEIPNFLNPHDSDKLRPRFRQHYTGGSPPHDNSAAPPSTNGQFVRAINVNECGINRSPLAPEFEFISLLLLRTPDDALRLFATQHEFLWDHSDRRALLLATFPPPSVSYGYRLHPDGHLLAVISHANVRVWDLRPGNHAAPQREPLHLLSQTIGTRNLAGEINGCRASDDLLCVWNGAKLRVLRKDITLDGMFPYGEPVEFEPGIPVDNVIPHPDQRHVWLHSRAGKTVEFWDLTPKTVFRLDLPARLRGLVVAPQGTHVATFDEDYNIQVWEVAARGKCRAGNMTGKSSGPNSLPMAIGC